MKRLTRYRYFSIIVIAIQILVCSVLTLFFQSVLSSQHSEPFIAVTTTIFGVVTVLLICQLIRLLQTATKGFGSEFKNELNKIKWHLAILVFTFLMRVVALWLSFFRKWPIFPREFQIERAKKKTDK